ncbi:MAG: hypothetical protein E7135_01740 [Rikenellaceae bacterium]|nr:hypothetical protein [Rikenellaceae bacterium]
MSSAVTIMSRLKQSQLFKDSFWALVGSAIGKGLSLIAGIVVARLLGSEAYGEYGTIKNTLLMIAIFSSMGLGYSATKFIAENLSANNLQRIIQTHRIATRITLVVSGVISILVLVASNIIAIWLEAPHLSPALRISAIAVIFNALNTTQTGELAGFGAYRKLAINNTWTGIFTFISSLILTYYNGFYGAIIALTISLIFNAILNQRTIRSYLKQITPPCNIDRVYSKEIIKFSLPIALQESLYAITNWLSIYILIKFANYTELGLYSAAIQWMAVVLFIPGALRNVALSHFSSVNNDCTQTDKILKRLMLVNFISTFVPFIVICIMSGWIESVYGVSFNGLQEVLNICVFTAIISSLTNVLTQEFISQGQNWFLFISRLIRDITILILLCCAVSTYSGGALLCATISLFGQSLYLFLLLIKYHHIRNVQQNSIP